MKIGIIGCCGKVGKSLLTEIYYKDPALLGGLLESSSSSCIGLDIGDILGVEKLGIVVSHDPKDAFSQSNVMLDFTTASASIENIKNAIKYKKPIVIGTTGFNDTQEAMIKEFSKEIPIVKSSNMSLGTNILFKLVEAAAEILSSKDYDVEIIEKHHRDKKDAPSGTALALGNIIAKVRNKTLADIYHSNRKGITSGREKEKIGFSSIRGGDLVGEHSVLFIGDGEVIELKHIANNRTIFINGALKAAEWIIGKPNGLYSFREIVDQK